MFPNPDLGDLQTPHVFALSQLGVSENVDGLSGSMEGAKTWADCRSLKTGLGNNVFNEVLMVNHYA